MAGQLITKIIRQPRKKDNWSIHKKDNWSTPNKDYWSTHNKDNWSTPNKDNWSTPNKDDWSTPNKDDWSTPNKDDWSTHHSSTEDIVDSKVLFRDSAVHQDLPSTSRNVVLPNPSSYEECSTTENVAIGTSDISPNDSMDMLCELFPYMDFDMMYDVFIGCGSNLQTAVQLLQQD